jgi:pimeloyl-ACP methyl ester carboxylesterase
VSALAYDRNGSGDPLLLVHGLGSARTTWLPLLPALAARYDVIAVDLPGHGDTPPLPRTEPATPGRLAKRLALLLDELGLVSAHVMGNSLGGWVGLELAADGRARSLTGLAPAGLWLEPSLRRSPTLQLNRRLAVATRPLHPILLRSPLVRSLTFASGSAWPAEIPYEIVVAAARAQADAPGYTAALDGTLGIRFDRAEQIGADVPVTAIFGDRDRILPAPALQQRSLLPDHASWVMLPGCGHAIQWDAPGAVMRELVRTTSASASPSASLSASLSAPPSAPPSVSASGA